MPVTPTYPGIYIEELPSTSHTIAAAPTSVTVFIGYAHPWKTPAAKFGKAIQIFSYAEYERNFGGLLLSNTLDVSLPYAVQQFFLNGGSEAYIVALQPKNYMSAANASTGVIAAATAANVANKIHFTALEATDVKPISVQITDRDSVGHLTGDIDITYGDQPPEKYRNVSLTGTPANNANHVVTRLASSAYVTVTTDAGALFSSETVALNTAIPANTVGTFELASFTAVFQADSDLDKVPIFNLIVLPGITHSTVMSEALAFAEKKQAFVIMDPAPELNPVGGTADANSIAWFMNTAPKSTNGAIYFPFLKTTNLLTGNEIELPPSGLRRRHLRAHGHESRRVEGARRSGDDGVEHDRRRRHRPDDRHASGRVEPDRASMRCARSPASGRWSSARARWSRPTSAFQQWKYVPVRRMALFIEQTLLRNLGWVDLRAERRAAVDGASASSVENFMQSLFTPGCVPGHESRARRSS